MAHNIFGQRFYGNREPAWHGLGVVSDKDQNGVEALTAIGGGYWFEKRPVTVDLNGMPTKTGDFAIVRSPLPDDPQEKVFGYTTDRYKIMQPLDVVELFDTKVNKPIETLGMLGKGERLFLTWKMPEFDVVANDTVKNFGFVAIGFDAVMGASLNVVTTRVVCQNTWMAAIAEAEGTKERGKGRIYSGKHTSGNMQKELGAWMGYVDQEATRQVALTNSLFKRFSQIPLEQENEVYKLLFSAYPDPEKLSVNAYIPDSLRKGKEEKIEMEAEGMKRNRDGIYSLFSGMGTQITPDYWGLFNATTEWFNYGQTEKKPANLSILMGNRAKRMNDMVEVLSYEANKI